MHWTENMFLEHGDLFLKVMEWREERAPQEVETLARIFSEMGIQRGDRVLDLCCGTGRHSLRLAEMGFTVTGVDISPLAIEYAREMARNTGAQQRVEFLLGDCRKVLKLLKGKRGNFNATIIMWDSIGYYDEETDRSVLRQLNNLAAPDGILIMDVTNRDFVVKHYQPFGIRDLGDCELHEQRKLYLETSRAEAAWKFYRKEDDGLKHLATVQMDNRLYSLHELIRLLETTGWKYVNAYGNIKLEPVTSDTNRIIIVGKKRA